MEGAPATVASSGTGQAKPAGLDTLGSSASRAGGWALPRLAVLNQAQV